MRKDLKGRNDKKSHPHFFNAFGEKEQKIKVLNIEKNLKFREKK